MNFRPQPRVTQAVGSATGTTVDEAGITPATLRGGPPPEAAAGRSVTYPRAFVALSATLESGTPGTARGLAPGATAVVDQVDTGVVPNHASVVLRSHSQAGEATVTLVGAALPFDPRQVAGVFMQVYLGAVPSMRDPVNARGYLRFVGFVDEMRPKLGEEGTLVELKARDLSAIYRDFHPLPAALTPRYSDTLGAAIQRIIDGTPGSLNADGTPRVRLRDTPLLARAMLTAVNARTPGARVPLPSNPSAWQVIEHVTGLLSVLVSVDLDEIVLRAPSKDYADRPPPAATFVFGGPEANLLSVESTKKFVRNRRGVRVIAYDPTGNARVTADFPTDAELGRERRPEARLGRARVAVGGSGTLTSTARAAADAPENQRDVFPVPFGMYTPAAMRDHAERIYLERSRQELEGTLVTPVWSNEALGLRNADRFVLRIRPDLEAELARFPDDEARAVDLLVRRLGLDREAAKALILAARSRPTDLFYAREVTHEFDATSGGTTSVGFLNLIAVDSTLV